MLKTSFKKVGRLGPLLTITAAIAVIVAVVFPRSTALLWGLPVALILTQAVRSRTFPQPFDVSYWAAVAGLAFAAWAMTSALWSLNPYASLTKPLFLFVIIGGLVLASMTPLAGTAQAAAIAKGVLLGVLISGLILAVEIWSNQGMARAILTAVPSLQVGYEKHIQTVDGIVVHVSEAQINRRVTVLSLLLVASILIALRALAGAAQFAALGLLGIIALAVLSVTGHQSSQLAIIAGGTTLALAAISPRLTRVLVAVAWIGAVTLMPVAAIFLYQQQAQTITALPNSARHRVIIWKDTTDQIGLRPILGIGADASAALARQRNKSPPDAEVESDFGRSIAPHAHNGFLQVWHELGGVGALLFMVAGLVLLFGATTPLTVAYFAIVAVMLSVSYSIWQVWFQAAMAIGLAATLLGQRLGPERAGDQIL